ncbi:amidase [Rhizoctonia solani]|uniref:Amidase n=1 Tax=Rhizoctonia solani TaxID=456999 RepID=A0A8H8SUC6_9AGAM|nr:amidase [Rhizoctonia solani]QRW17247.1 amidase [Rhizoctonia solani]
MPNPTIDKKQQLRAKLIDKGRSAVEAEGTNSALRHRIISSNLRDLVGGITKHEWTATQVVTAFIAQAIKAHDLTNCLTEILFEPALKAAGELDDYFNQTGQLRGPLHGVPFTFKDQYEIKGYDNTIGFTHWADQHANQDAELVALARSLGGVVIAKTNVPQTMLSFECDNPLWGKTTNPYNESNTAGGSSGGEAAVLRFGGSALGMGSDIGGSLRIPTSYSVEAQSASSVSISFSPILKYIYNVGCVPGFTGITTVYGPMARSVADVKYACEVFFGQQATVPAATLPPVKYRTDLDLSKPLKIGYFKTDRFVRASPACQRAVLESVEALKGKGHIIEEISPPDIAELLKLFVELSSADGYNTMLSHLQSDKQEPALFLVTLGPRLPAFVRALSNLLVRLFINDTTFTRLFGASRPRTVSELWASSAARLAADSALQNHLWSQTLNLDVLICPVQAVPAIPHGATKTLTPIAASTLAWNVVECPVGIVPVTHVQPDKDALPADWFEKPTAGPVIRPSGENKVVEVEVEPSPLFERAVYGSGTRLLQPLDEPVPVYDAEKMKGLPVGVQIVGKPWEDEKVIYVMEVLDEALGKREPGFGPSANEVWRTGT